MQAQLQKLAALEAENSRLREMLASTEHMSERLSIAEIMRLDMNPYRQRIVINRGSVDKVYVGQPIIDAYGVMGQITEVGPRSAIALLITDANHSLPVEVIRNGLRTIAQGSGKDNLLELPYLTNNADIRAGDMLVTSGLDGRFPRGYPVARVLRVESDGSDQFARITATPIAHLDRSLEVLLVWRQDDKAPCRQIRRGPHTYRRSGSVPVNWPFIQRQLVLMASFGIALGLDLMPLPHWLAYWRPDWLALVLIYWGMALPDRVGLGTAWLLGLLLDVLTGTILGAHALALVLIAYVVQRFYLQLRAFPVWQQSFFLLFLLALYQLPLIWLLALGAQHQPILAWQTIISGSLMWPLIFASLRGMQGRYDLS